MDDVVVGRLSRGPTDEKISERKREGEKRRWHGEYGESVARAKKVRVVHHRDMKNGNVSALLVFFSFGSALR